MKIAIIDDTQKQFDFFKLCVIAEFGDECTVVPNNGDDYKALNRSIKNYFNPGTKSAIKKSSKVRITEILDQCDGFVLDYELQDGKSTTCNAKIFYNDFLKSQYHNKPILLISGLPNSTYKQVKELKDEISANVDDLQIPNKTNDTYAIEVKEKMRKLFGGHNTDSLKEQVINLITIAYNNAEGNKTRQQKHTILIEKVKTIDDFDLLSDVLSVCKKNTQITENYIVKITDILQ